MSNPKAEKAQVAGQARIAGRLTWAKEGPRLHEGTIYVPSPHFNQEAKNFWQTQEFRFVRAEYSNQHEWARDTTKPWRGKRYSQQAWLKSIREKYFEFYPEFQERKGEK